MNNYLKDFIIGSSFPVFILFFIIVANIKNKNYSYEKYSIIAPLYLGLMNVLSGELQKKYNLSDKNRYLYISLISATIVVLYAYFSGSYRYSYNYSYYWILYILIVFSLHLFVFNVIVYNLNKIIENYK